MRKILITGATGFTGSKVVPSLLESYGEVTCFVRASSDRTAIDLPGVTFAVGDLDDSPSLEAALRGKDTLISIAYLAGKGKPGSRAEGIVEACRATNVSRAVFVSSTSIFTTIAAPAKVGKLAAESAIINSGLNYTILRPTMIYGTPGDRNMIRIIRFLQRSPVMFMPGSGKFQQQPVHVEDLAKAISDCIEVPETFGKAYNLSGAFALRFEEVIDQICDALGVKRMKISVPLQPALWLARISHHLPGKPLIKEEQIRRLNEDKSFDHSEARRDFGFNPRTFEEGIRQEVSLLRNGRQPWRGVGEARPMENS